MNQNMDTSAVRATIRHFDENPMPLTERCDRCGAQAFIRVTLPGGNDLLFCAHHFGRAHDKLVAIEGAFIDDYSPALEAEVKEAQRKLAGG